MADEKVNSGPEEVNAAEPEVTEEAAGSSPPEAAVMEPEQPETAEPVMEDTPAQASLFGEDAPSAEQPEPSAPGGDGEVVVSFEKISELISQRNKAAREAVEKEAAVTPQAEGTDKGQDEPAQEEAAPKRRGRPPKAERAEQGEQAPPKRRGRKPKDAAREQDTTEGKSRDKVSRGRRGKPAPEQPTPGGGDSPAVGESTSVPDTAQPAAPAAEETAAPPRPVEDQKVVYLKLSELHPFHTFRPHPFQVRDDAKMQETVTSIKLNGVMVPGLARPEKDGSGYEIIAGHRRCRGSELAGLDEMPFIVRDMTDHEAVQAMKDSNKQRDATLPMEMARLLDLEMEDIKHQGVQLKNVAPGDIGKRSAEIVGEAHDMNYKKVMRYIRLNSLVPELQDMVDGTAVNANGEPIKKLGFIPAVELSFIRPKNQQLIAVSIEGEQASPSVSQAKKLRELDQANKLTGDVIDAILSEEKKEVGQVIISTDELSKYFGQEVTPRQMKEQIMALLDEWKEKQPPEKKAELEK